MYTVKITGNLNLHMKKQQHVKAIAIMQTVHAQVLTMKKSCFLHPYIMFTP